MIWLKENHSLIGYVPVLKKEYTEKDIREMSKYHCFQGWSKLSGLVMQIQGIEFVYNSCYPRESYRVRPERIVDVFCDFDFECFTFPDVPVMEKYIRQIFDLFENLTLYKVEEHSEEEIKESSLQVRHALKQVIANLSKLPEIFQLDNIDETIKEIKESSLQVKRTHQRIIAYAERSATNLSKLQKMFQDKGYLLSHNIFANINETISKEIYTERVAKTILEMNC